MSSRQDTDTGRPPACPVCSRRMVFCGPSHEKPYWACPSDHEPAGIVLRGRDVEYAFSLARVRLLDTFEEGRLDVFGDVERPGDVAGIAVEEVLQRLEACVAHKRMRQRKGHDDTPGDARPTVAAPEQSDLGRWSA